jgi:hypothetical protein
MKLLVNLAKADPIGAKAWIHCSRSRSVRNLRERIIESGTTGAD